MIRGRQLFQRGQAALYLFGVDAVGKADIARYAKGIAGHQQQVKFPGPAAEGVGILLQCLGEEIEGAAGPLDLNAQRFQLVVKQIHIGLVDAQVAGHIQAAAHGALDDAGRAVVTGKSGDLGHHVHKDVLAFTARTHRHITKALAGQAQALGIGEAGESVGVERRRVGHLFAVECDIPVGFIADEEDVVAKSLALLGQDLGHAGERPGRVDHAGFQDLLP